MYNTVKLSKTTRIVFIVLGVIFSILPPWGSFLLFYSNFFEREMYLNRKNLLKYLKTASVNAPHFICGSYKWKLEGYTLYMWDKDRWSLHSETSNWLLSSFHSGILDRYYYNKIKAILKKSIEENT